MHFLVKNLEELGLRWAYRVVDTRSFGLPQRRLRVILVASKDEDPRDVLFSDEAAETLPTERSGHACGFYWTEGTRGLGWAIDAIPTLKGGSTIGIASPPAIWTQDDDIVTPDIDDCERIQGFDAGWTEPAIGRRGRIGTRWKLVGNAVSVPVARWVGCRLGSPGIHDWSRETALDGSASWPTAASGERGKVRKVEISTWPVSETYQHLANFLRYPTVALSRRASEGFYGRAMQSSLRFPKGLLEAVAGHIQRITSAAA
jgi:DNA (cytosine-5)-methyltransferase 1